MLLADTKRKFKEFYEITDGMNPEIRRKYLTDVRQKNMKALMMWWKLKINMGTWYYHEWIFHLLVL